MPATIRKGVADDFTREGGALCGAGPAVFINSKVRLCYTVEKQVRDSLRIQ